MAVAFGAQPPVPDVCPPGAPGPALLVSLVEFAAAAAAAAAAFGHSPRKALDALTAAPVWQVAAHYR